MVENGTASDQQGIDEPEIIYGGTSGIPTDDGIPRIDPKTIEYEPEPEHRRTGRRGGRPKGSRNSNTKARKENTNDLTGILYSLHMMGAALTGIEELNLDESEAKKLSDAIGKVNAYYGGMVLPENIMVWTQFVIAMGTVYGPRAVAYSMRLKREHAQGPQTVDNQAPVRVM